MQQEYDYDVDEGEPLAHGEGMVPIGRKRNVRFRTRDGDVGTKERVYTRYRACLVCRLIATEEQFLKHGCPNCAFLEFQGNRSNVQDCTTTKFSGMLALMKPSQSWAARFNGLSTGVPGCYAVHSHGELPERIRDEVSYRLRHAAAARD